MSTSISDKVIQILYTCNQNINIKKNSKFLKDDIFFLNQTLQIGIFSCYEKHDLLYHKQRNFFEIKRNYFAEFKTLSPTL